MFNPFPISCFLVKITAYPCTVFGFSGFSSVHFPFENGRDQGREEKKNNSKFNFEIPKVVFELL